MKHELYPDMLQGTRREPIFCDDLREAIRDAAIAVKARCDALRDNEPCECCRPGDTREDFEADIRQAFADSLKIRVTPAEHESDKKSEANSEGRLLPQGRTNFHE